MIDERKGFVHLHVHSEYSLLDGACRLFQKRDATEEEIATAIENGVPKEKAVKDKSMYPLTDAARARGQKAIALTDHGNMFGAYKFLTNGAALQPDFNSIIGCEIYLAEDMYKKDAKSDDDSGIGGNYTHLILLAKNYQGYLNLCEICSAGYIEGFYFRPRVDMGILRKFCSDLVCLSGCIAGKIPRLILNNRYDQAKEFALELKELFGEDFYIELQNHELTDEKYVLPQLIKLAGEIGVKCVATNDIHYIEKSDSEMHHTLVSIRSAKMADGYKPEEYYMRTEEEMLERFDFFPEAVWNTVEVADKCKVTLPKKQCLLPAYVGEEKTRLKMDSKEYLRYITTAGLKNRYKDKLAQDIIDRADSELTVIINMNFEDYFLVVWDFINYAKSIGVPVGPGRGSGVGSVVAYAIGITDVEPLQFALIFERFLSEGRDDYPDFDIDFCCNRRQEVIDYVCNKYGFDNTCRIATFGTMKAKQAFKDVCRVYNIPLSEVSRISKYIPKVISRFEHLLHDHYSEETGEKLPTSVKEIIDIYENDERFKKIIDIVLKIDTMPRQPSMHAAGVIICNSPVRHYLPLAVNIKNGERNIITQFDKTEVEPIGLLKMDFLGLVTLTDIRLACDYVKQNYGVDLDFSKMDTCDAEVYKLIGEGKTDGVFQLEGGGMKGFMASLKPEKIDDVIAGISIYRPGPMKFKDVFVANKRDPSRITYLTPKMKNILDVTYGIIVYQEQAMQMARDLAGYTMKEANNFRKIISKKKSDKMREQCEKFVAGCINNGIAPDIANKIFDQLKDFCSYAFNKSHAAAYAYLSYQTAYLKRYYPAELFSAILNNRISKADEIAKYIKILRDEEGIPLLGPDINKSQLGFSTDGKIVRYGLMGVKNVGKNAVEAIIEERELHGEYKDMSDFLSRAGDAVLKKQNATLNKRMIECLIYGGAFDSFGHTRCTLITNYERIIALEEQARTARATGQFSMFDMITEGGGHEPFEYVIRPEYPTREKLALEKDMLGMYVTGNPLDGYEEDFKNFNFNTSMIASVAEDEDIEEEEDADTADDKQDSGLYDKMSITCGGIRSKIEGKRTKDGKEFCIFNLEDMYGTVEVVVYPNTYQRCRKFLDDDTLLNNDMVKIKGQLSIRDGEKIKITANNIEVWDLKEKEMQNTKLTPKELAVSDSHKMVFVEVDKHFTQGELVVEILHSHPGRYPVSIMLDGALYKFKETVGDLEDLVKELRAIVGWGGVRIIDRDELKNK